MGEQPTEGEWLEGQHPGAQEAAEAEERAGELEAVAADHADAADAALERLEALEADAREQDARRRFELAAGLRELAVYLESDVAAELPINRWVELSLDLWVYEHETAALEGESIDAAMRRRVRDIARALKPVDKDESGSYFILRRRFGAALKVEVNAQRDRVCELVSTGETEPVTLRAVPESREDEAQELRERLEGLAVTTTERVERREWRCPPLLAGEEGRANG